MNHDNDVYSTTEGVGISHLKLIRVSGLKHGMHPPYPRTYPLRCELIREHIPIYPPYPRTYPQIYPTS